MTPNIQILTEAQEKARELGRVRWRRRQVLADIGRKMSTRFDDNGAPNGWGVVPWKRTVGCGCAMDDVEIKAKDDALGNRFAWYSKGVITCGSVWLCPVCCAKIRRRRTADVEHLARWHAERGGELVMMTLTFGHNVGDELAVLLPGQQSAWKAFQDHDFWRHEIKPALEGQVSTLEITHGFADRQYRNGWHPHLHVLLLVKNGHGEAVREALSARGYDIWADDVVTHLGSTHRPSVGRGFDVRTIAADAAAYITKIAQEVTRGDLKSGIRQPWELIDRMDTLGNGWAVGRWVEYAIATKGHRSVRWSWGLRAKCGLGADKTDAEIALEAIEGGVVVDNVPKRRHNREMRAKNPRARLERHEAGWLPTLAISSTTHAFDRAKCRGPSG